MCKSLQYCLESCYWHLIEKRFCYDESIALYEEPETIKEEKNNNFFDNMAFYDSVSVIAGRAVVTIEPLPEDTMPIVQQPRRRLRWDQDEDTEIVIAKPERLLPKLSLSKSAPAISEAIVEEEQESDEKTKSDDALDAPKTSAPQTLGVDAITNVELRRKSLRDRRMSKSLYLKIDLPKEIPIIRQQSMPKFYLDTPDESQTKNVTSMFRSPSTALTSPVPSKSAAFVYDLYSVVQMEKERVQSMEAQGSPSQKDAHASRLNLIKERIKLRRVKSSAGPITNLPHSHHHI